MLPIRFDPVLPVACLILALCAPSLIAARRARRARTAVDWGRVARLTLLGCVGLIVSLFASLPLEAAASSTVRRTQGGQGFDDPLTWLGLSTTFFAVSARLVWQGALLVGPTLFAAHRLAGWRPRLGWLRVSAILLAGPVLAWAVLAVVPLTLPSTTVLALGLMVFVVVLALTWPPATPLEPWDAADPEPTRVMAAPSLLSQPIALRAPVGEAQPSTRVTRLPAAMAASLLTPTPVVDPDRTQPIAPPAATSPAPRPTVAMLRLPEAAVRRARRSRRTLADPR